MKNFFKNKTFIIVLIVSFFGVSFGSNLLAQNSAERTVVITITESSDGGDPTYTVVPYNLVIAENLSRVPIKFKLKSHNYEFINSGNNGFDITPVDDNFKIIGLSKGNKRLHLLDFNKVKVNYDYTITVINPKTRETLLIDPRIENGGGGNP